MSYPYERCNGCPQCASPPETFISKSSGKVIRKVQHGTPRIITSPANALELTLTTPITTDVDPRILIMGLKDLEKKQKAEQREVERKRIAEERKKAQEEAAAERRRQKTKAANNQMSKELGIGIELN